MILRHFLTYKSAIVRSCAIALVIGSFMACNKLDEPDNPIQLNECANMPEARSSASAVAVGDMAYILGGRTLSSSACKYHPEGYPTTIWQYNATTNQWNNIGKLPCCGRVNATALVVDSCIYFGLGFSGNIYTDSCYLTDWWKYDVVTKDWTRLADFPCEFADHCQSYLIGKDIYACYGFGTYGYSRTICHYNITTDTWEKLPDNNKRMPAVIGAVGGQCGELCFIGGGYSTDILNSKLWYEFNPKLDSWCKRAKLPQGRLYSTSITNQSHIYLIGGRHWGGSDNDRALFDQILQYEVNNDKWTLRGHLPQGYENMIAFKIGDTIYVGLGEDADGQISNKIYAWHD